MAFADEYDVVLPNIPVTAKDLSKNKIEDEDLLGANPNSFIGHPEHEEDLIGTGAIENPSFGNEADILLQESKKPNPYESMPTSQKVYQGAKEALLSQWLALKQLGEPLYPEKKQSIEKEVKEQRTRTENLLQYPSAMTGYIGANIGEALLGGEAIQAAGGLAKLPSLETIGSQIINPSNYKAAATVGATQGLLTPTLEDESKLARVGVGAGAGIAGLGATNAVGRIAQPIKNELNVAGQKAVNTLKNAGIDLDLAQQTGSAFLSKAKAMLNDNPLTAGFQQAFAQKQKSQFNNAVLKTIGEDSHVADATTMGRAADRIDNQFKSILENNNLNINDDVLSKIGGIQKESHTFLGDKNPVSTLSNEIINSVDENGQISGQKAYAIKKQLDRASSSPDSTLAYHARQLRGAVMDAFNNSLNKEDQEAFKTARLQFRNMKIIENAIDKSGSGDISPSILANTVGTKANRGASIYGKGDQTLINLAQSGKQVIPEKIPNSGTATRILAHNLPLSLAGAGYGLYTGDYKTAATGALGGFAIPNIMQKAITNPSVINYGTKGIQSKALRELLNAPGNLGMQKIPISQFTAYELKQKPEKREQ